MATEAAIIVPVQVSGKATSTRLLDAALARCNQPVDGSSLALFRILFGCVMVFAMVRLLLKGWVQELYLAPAFHFTWEWFPWVKALPGTGMYLLVTGLALLALGMAFGWRYRFCAILFFFGFTYLELIDQTTYLNHYYLVSLLSGLLIFLPASSVWSWETRGHAVSTVPAWTVWLLRFQLCVVYFFAGLAKVNADWLFEAQPMRIWLAARSDLPIIGEFLARTWVAYAASWTGALYDLTIPFWLFWSRSRPWAYLAVIGFHAMTSVLFSIGMFPWIMMVATLVFFPPEWVKGVVAMLNQRIRGSQLLPALDSASKPPAYRLKAWSFILLAVYAVLQIALPLRSYYYPQQGAWDGRGFNFAWRVMLVEKTGYVEFYAFNPDTGKRERLGVDHLITPRQKVMMAQDPGMIAQLARRLAEDFPTMGKSGWEVRADAWATLNGCPSQRLIRPDVNLAGPLPTDWIVPLRED
ncbi:MAG: HTTM domain-containing protein [Verrucomicrobiota bacterium]